MKKQPAQVLPNSRGAAIFKKMLEDKNAIRNHIAMGGNFSDLKGKFNFVKPLPASGE